MSSWGETRFSRKFGPAKISCYTVRHLDSQLTFLAKLLASIDDIISSGIFTSLAIMDVYNVSIVQQCQLLESELNTKVLALCLKNPEDAPAIVKLMKTDIIKSIFEVLLSSAAIHPSAKYVSTVAETTSWCWLWDVLWTLNGTCMTFSRYILDGKVCVVVRNCLGSNG